MAFIKALALVIILAIVLAHNCAQAQFNSSLVIQTSNETVIDADETPKAIRPLRFENCGRASNPFQLKDLKATPFPLSLKGKNNITFTSTLSKDISGLITLELDLIYGKTQIPCINGFGSCTYEDICRTLIDPTGCLGIPTGFYTYGFQVAFPALASAGEYTAYANFKVQTRYIGCVRVDFQVV